LTDFTVARYNLRQYRGRVVSLALAVVFGSVVSLVCIGLVGRAATSVQTSINEDVALRTVQLQDDPTRTDLKPLRGPNVSTLQSISHVAAVEPWLQASFGIKTPEIGGALLYATPARPSSLPPIVRSIRSNVFPLSDGEAVLPEQVQGENLNSLLGKRVPVSYTRKVSEGAGEAATDQVTVVALYSPKYELDGPSAAYVNADQLVRWAAARAGVPADLFLNTVGYRKVYAIVDTSANVPAVVSALRADGYSATTLQELLTALPSGLRAIRTLGVVVFMLLMVYGAMAGIAISGSFMKSRTREIGLLNALGFRPSRILRILLLELFIVGGTAGFLGAVLGGVASAVTGTALGGHELFGVVMPKGVAWPPWSWMVVILLAPAITVTVGGLVPAWRVAQLQPDLALRDQV
jgi:putative ABC transport system permease protein